MSLFKKLNFGFKIIRNASKKFFIYKVLVLCLKLILTFLSFFLWRYLIEVLYDIFLFDEIYIYMKKCVIIVMFYCLIYVFLNVINSLNELITFKLNDRINYYLDNTLVNKIANIDLGYFDSSILSDLAKNSWELINSAQILVECLFSAVKIVIEIIMVVVLLFEINFFVIFSIIALTIPYFFIDKFIKNKNYINLKENINIKRRMEYYKNIYFDGNLQEIRLYNLTEYFQKLYSNAYESYEKNIFKNEKKCLNAKILSFFLLFISNSIVYFYLIIQCVKGVIGLEDLTYFISILILFRTNINSFISLFNEFNTTLEKIDDLQEFINLKPLVEKSGNITITEVNIITFKNVYFRYPNCQQYILKNCSFEIKKGEVVGLVGLNGAGKSTIVKLLLRLYIPEKGDILLNNVPIENYNILELRKSFSVLFQDYIKYSFTMRENIALSDLTKINDDVKLFETCELSDLLPIIQHWEKGLDENLTKRFYSDGKELSGGQWQRVAIARTLLRDSAIVILDEPSAALDPIAEEEIFMKFKTISKNKTTILITHRLSSIRIANKIFVLDDGCIVESGTHNELMKKEGVYYNFFKLQASKYINNN